MSVLQQALNRYLIISDIYTQKKVSTISYTINFDELDYQYFKSCGAIKLFGLKTSDDLSYISMKKIKDLYCIKKQILYQNESKKIVFSQIVAGIDVLKLVYWLRYTDNFKDSEICAQLRNFLKYKESEDKEFILCLIEIKNNIIPLI